MSKVIDLRGGFADLSEEEKLYLAARGRLPKEHITDGIRQALNLSGEASTVAYGAHTGTVATMTEAELEQELERRRKTAKEAPGGNKNARKELMPDLDNPNSERLDYVEGAHKAKKESGEEGKRLAASTTAATGPVVPSLGAPGQTQRVEVGGTAADDDEDEDEGLSPEDYAEPDTATPNAELRAEIARRNEQRREQGFDDLSLDGNKATLVETLQADDAERGGEEEE